MSSGVINKNLNNITGLQRTAIVLLSLSPENAANIMSQFTEDEIKEVSYTMSFLGNVGAEVINLVMEKLSQDLVADAMFLGNIRTTEKLLSRVLDQDAVAAVIEEISGPQGKNTWEKLSNVNEELLALYLRNEHPQTAALVLSKIAPDHSAKVISYLPEDFAFDVISRMLSITNVKKEVLERVEKTLRADFISSATKSNKDNSVEMLAQIFNNFDRSSESKFMSMLEDKMPDAASKIKEMMFTFEDLLRINPKGIQRLLRDVDKSRLTLALKSASSELKAAIFSSMSQRAVKLIEEDMLAMGPVRVKDVDLARSEIVMVAKRLIEQEEIAINLDKEKDEFIS